jgi:hypothetical protein
MIQTIRLKFIRNIAVLTLVTRYGRTSITTADHSKIPSIYFELMEVAKNIYKFPRPESEYVLDLPEEKIEYLKEHWTTQTYLELSKNMGVRIGVIQQASKKLCLPRKIPNRIKPHILLGEKGLRHGDRLII